LRRERKYEKNNKNNNFVIYNNNKKFFCELMNYYCERQKNKKKFTTNRAQRISEIFHALKESSQHIEKYEGEQKKYQKCFLHLFKVSFFVVTL
jgi:predicted transcriptional regulator